MDILSKIASALDRRDEVPNQELAREIIETEDKNAVEELIKNVEHKDKAVQNDCIKIIYEIGRKRPDLIGTYFEIFLGLLNHRNNRMQWGAMIALNCIVELKPKGTFDHLGYIISSAEKGSVITRDHAMNIIISLGKVKQYKEDAFLLFKEQLLKSPINQLPMYAERAIPIIDANNSKVFIEILEHRMPELEKASQKKRLQKVIKKVKM